MKSVTMLNAVLLAISLAQAEERQWLNVRDCGASGSAFETTAATTAGSKQITVKYVGDFKVGQRVMVSRCNIRYVNPTLWGPGEPYIGASKDTGLETRGYDGSAGSWIVFLLEIDSAGPTFRWSDDLARSWKATKVPVTHDWQPLGGGVEVRFSRREWKPGHMVSFSARDQLVSVIEKIEGNVLTLRAEANRTASDAVVRHCDSMALQAAIDRAIREKQNVFIPVGRYRLANGLFVRNASAIVIEGQSAEDTILDITDGQGACLALDRGTEVTVRNLRLVGHTGLAEQPGAFRTSSGFSFWACTLKSCGGASINGTERVLFENVHASRMASECFISGGPYRRGAEEPKQYTKSATFLRCSVTDCAANAFNNCDFAENTSVLHCRIDGAGWHAYEGSGRFVRFIGNYVRNAGPVTIGDIPHTLPRLDHYHDLGIGQAIVRDNVFEGIGRCGGVTVIYGTAQVVVANNLFINYNGNAIHASSATVHNNYPSRNITISGNIIDLTYSGEKPAARIGINVSASDTQVHDNQIYVRGECDPKVTGLQLRDGALNVNAHDNLIRNCGRGITTQRLSGTITETADSRTFRQTGLPLEWRTSHLYRNWSLVWLKVNKPAEQSVIDGYDATALQFKLKEPRDMKAGDRFEVFPPSANWNLHDNIITGCAQPVVLTSHGSDTSFFRDNLIERGGATNATSALVVTGQFKLIGNHIAGFDERTAPTKSAKQEKPARREGI
ncbi:MAG: right-handed parallel beta-helix repeat-containing protein [Verrucomicrobia bacterium]|nr:right-handed parallel beta-helix repeat-containing protein [Verrucomicrobiota bacterium]